MLSSYEQYGYTITLYMYSVLLSGARYIDDTIILYSYATRQLYFTALPGCHASVIITPDLLIQ